MAPKGSAKNAPLRRGGSTGGAASQAARDGSTGGAASQAAPATIGGGKGQGKALFVTEGWTDVSGHVMEGEVKLEESGFWMWAYNGVRSAEEVDGLVMTWFVTDGGDGGYWRWSTSATMWEAVRAAHGAEGFVWLPRAAGEAGTGSGVDDPAAGHREPWDMVLDNLLGHGPVPGDFAQ